MRLTAAHDPALLGTLAAAYAESGAFEKAIELEQSAAILAAQQGDTDLAATLDNRIAMFKAKTPIRQR